MSQSHWSSDEQALINALERLMSERFGELRGPGVRAVFEEVLTRLEKAPAPQRSPEGWTGRMEREVASPVASTHQGGLIRADVEIVADTEALIDSLLHQILEVGAVLVQLDDPPGLNDIVQVKLSFPHAHLEVEARARVVHQSERGTAIEVSGLSREDRVTLQAVADDRQREAEAQAARETSVTEVPSTHPAPVDDAARSYSGFGAGRGSVTRTMQSAGRRRFDVPDPDMDVVRSTMQSMKSGFITREFYGPAPPWFEPDGDPDRVEALAGERVLDVLLQLSASGFTGALVHRSGTSQRQLLFESGYMVEMSSLPRAPGAELGPMLQAARRITKRQLAMAAAHADEFNSPLARSLLELDILDPDRIRHAISGRLTFLLREFCEERSGDVAIFDAAALPADFLPKPPLRVHLAVERVIYERLLRGLTQCMASERDQVMAPELDTYPEILIQERDRLERALSAAAQLRLVDKVLNGRRRLREVLTESALPPAETFAVVFALHRMGLLRFDRSLHQTVVRERLRENVTVKYLSVHKASYFEVLNVHWSSYSEVIEKAYGELKAQFDPSRIPAELEDEVHQRVREINERVEAAYAALAKRATRHGYRTRIMPEYKLAHAIPLFLKQSELAERRGQWAEARDAVRRVLEIEPDNAEGQRRLTRYEQIIEKGISPNPADTNQ
ncbi:hypothetical protein DL240_06475 [Lujinxingia litoralis]|uniref:J domain-containing protein n=1 Tax=Lujinxingia litoralis TaxID=2211119 RepID=A0A328C764_9DELT|nr:hypothetical protein [Lujinxingia litoralis]RAL23795.1 hypothetical protein DL240_06475 [Lujinxingia litoralis]